MMLIPNYYRGAAKHANKRSMAKQFPAPYSYTTSTGPWVIRYTSTQPGFAVAEAWRNRITPGLKDVQTWCLVDQLDDEACFFMLVQDGVVQEAGRSNKDDLNPIWLRRSNVVFLADDRLAAHLPEGISSVPVDPLTDADLEKFALKPTSTIKASWVAVLVVATLLAGGAGVTLLSPAPDPVHTAAPDPYIPYRQTLADSIEAATAVDNLVAMAAYGTGIPDGWELELISQQNNNLVLVANRLAGGLRPVINAWLAQHPTLVPYADISLDKLTVTHPQQATLLQWKDAPLPVVPIADTLVDTLIALGWTVSHHTTQANPPMAKASVSLSRQDALVADLQSLSGILAQLPVALSGTTLRPASLPGRFTLSLTLTFIGGAQ